MVEDAKSQRRAAKGRFTRKLNELRKSVNDDKGVEIVKQNYVCDVSRKRLSGSKRRVDIRVTTIV